jgi:hypothetical protein
MDAAGVEPELLAGSDIRCRPEVRARLAAIAVPFVRRVTAARVAEAARAAGLAMVDLAFFDRHASY